MSGVHFPDPIADDLISEDKLLERVEINCPDFCVDIVEFLIKKLLVSFVCPKT